MSRYVQVSVSTGDHLLTAGASGLAASTILRGSVSFKSLAGETIVFSLTTDSSGFKSKITLTREDKVCAAMDRMAAMRRVGA